MVMLLRVGIEPKAAGKVPEMKLLAIFKPVSAVKSAMESGI